MGICVSKSSKKSSENSNSPSPHRKSPCSHSNEAKNFYCIEQDKFYCPKCVSSMGGGETIIIPNEIMSKYHIEKFLGNGSYGNVFLVQIKNGTIKFALKIFIEKKENNSTILANSHHFTILKHVNLIEYVEMDFKNNCLLMELAETDLKCILNDLEKEDINVYIHDIMTGILFLHENNIIHRDLKPENILIKNKRAKISDFDCCKFLEYNKSKTKTSAIGTPEYMSPQMQNKISFDENSQEEFGKEVDVWSFGIILYKMLFKDLKKKPFIDKQYFEENTKYIFDIDKIPNEKYQAILKGNIY